MISVSGSAPLGTRLLSLTTPSGTATFLNPGLMIQPAQIRQEPTQTQSIPGVEQGNTATGYVVVTVNGSGPAPLSTLTMGIVQNASVVSQTSVFPGPLTTLASVGLDQAPGISRAFGLALVDFIAEQPDQSHRNG